MHASGAIPNSPQPALTQPTFPLAQKGFKEGDADCLRRTVNAIRNINRYRRDGDQEQQQANFVRSILETYGAEGGPRLPLDTMLT